MARIREELTRVTEGLYTLRQPFPNLGGDVGARMTIARLASGDLWVHSPLDTTPALYARIEELGPVRHVVAPSKLHYLGVRPYAARFPEASVFGTEKVAQKNLGVSFADVLQDEPPPEWGGEIEQLRVKGHPLLDEVVFFDRPSRTLILTDLLMQITPQALWATRMVGKALGIYDQPRLPVELRLTWKDRRAGRETIERILAWDFDRILFSHGPAVETGGKEVIREAYSFLLRT